MIIAPVQHPAEELNDRKPKEPVSLVFIELGHYNFRSVPAYTHRID